MMGVLDSLNPFSVAAMVAMLTRRKFVETGVGFLLGTFFAYFSGGIFLHLGFNNFLSNRIRFFPDYVVIIAYIILAIGLILYSLKLWKTKEEPKIEKSGLIETWPKAFVFGMVSTFMDLSSALPYFLVLGRLSEEQLPFLQQILAISFYNFIYVLPLAFLGIIRLKLSDSSAVLKKMKSAVFYFERRVLPPLLVCCAGVMVYAAQLALKYF